MNPMPTTDITNLGRRTTDRGTNTNGWGENVLVLAPSMAEEADAYCAEHLASFQGTADPNTLFVSLDGSPDRRVGVVCRGQAARPANVSVVCCDETRSAATARPVDGPGVEPGPWIGTVSLPADLTGLNTRIRQVLSAWEDDPGPVELCFHSLTALLRDIEDRAAAFRFCRIITSHLTAIGTRSHFHLDPAAVDEQTVTTFTRLFDRIEEPI